MIHIPYTTEDKWRYVVIYEGKTVPCALCDTPVSLGVEGPKMRWVCIKCLKAMKAALNETSTRCK